jgi:multidrug transporter EmrE-like cation transporter
VVCGNVVGNIFFKIGTGKMPVIGSVPFGESARSVLSVWFFLGVLGYALSFPTFVLLLTRQGISLAYPIVTGLTFTAIALISTIFLHESLTVVQIIGTVVVFIGLALLA